MINIYNALWAATVEGKIAFAEQIYDNEVSKFQSEINKLVVGTGEPGEESLPDQIAALEEKIDNHIAEKNQPNGYAGLDENGKIDPSLVDGVVGHVLGLEQFVASTALPAASADTVGKYYFVTNTNKIAEGVGNGADVPYAWEYIDPQSQVLYNRRGADEKGHANTLYRWDGAAMAAVSDPIAIGTVTGTAYDGAQGQANRDAINSLPANLVVKFGTITAAANGITIAYKDAAKVESSMNFSAVADKTLKLPNAVAKVGDGSTTSGAAGLMSPTDKANLDALVQMAGGTPDTGDGTGTPITPDTADYLKKSNAGIGVVKEYTKASAKKAIVAGDSIAVALGKLEYGIDNIFGGTGEEGSTGGDIVIPDIPDVDGTKIPVIDEPTDDTIGSDITAEQLPESGDDLKTIIKKQSQLIELLNKKIQLLNKLVQPAGYQLVYVEADVQP